MVAILGAAQRQFKGRLPMNSARNWVGGMLVAALCLPTVRAVGDPSEADKAVLCAAQSKGPGGLPVTLAQWAEGARLFGGLGTFHRPDQHPFAGGADLF